MRIQEKDFEILIHAEEIQDRIREMARLIHAEIELSRTEFVVVMNGAFVFAADLIRHLPDAVSLRFIQASSYNGIEQSNSVDLYFRDSLEFENKHVVIIEDIVDSGNTLEAIKQQIIGYSSISVATLLFKEVTFQYDVPPKYIGFKIPSVFVVGCGLDLDGWGRNLDSVYGLSPTSRAK